jgi:hypothetical protein
LHRPRTIADDDSTSSVPGISRVIGPAHGES